MAIKIMDSFEPAGSGFKVVDAKDISVTENVDHDLKYALKIIGYLLGLNTDCSDIGKYTTEIHKSNAAKTIFEIEDDILNLLKLIVGDPNIKIDSDLSGKTLNALKDAIDIINGDAATEGSFKKADKDQLESILKTISGNNDWSNIGDVADTHKLKSLHDEIETLKGIHDQINSVTYYAGVFDSIPPLTSPDTGEPLPTGAAVKDSDNDPIFFLKPGVVITVGAEQYITVKASQDDSYSWTGFGTATVHESRFQHIEGEIGTKDSTAVNNGDIWDNIKNIYAMLGAKNINPNDEKIYPKINSLETSLGAVSDNKPADTVWSSIESLYQQVKIGDIKIDSTSYSVTNSKNATITGNPYISRIWAGNSYTFAVNHTFNKTPTIGSSDGWTITGHNSTKSVTNSNTITVTATDAYGKSVEKTNTIYLEYPVIVEAYNGTAPTESTLPNSSSSSWYKQYTITVDGSSKNNIAVLVYNPSTINKDVTDIITNVTGNGFNIAGAFVKDSEYTSDTGYVRYKLVQNVTAKTEYKFTINKTT